MSVLLYLMQVIFFAGFGMFLVQYLTVHPKKIPLCLLAAGVTLAGGVILLVTGFSEGQTWVGVTLALISTLVGYIWMTLRVLKRQDSESIPELFRSADDLGSGHTGVIYFTHGEPETYDPTGWINQFREFDEQKILFVPFLVRPFFLHNLRKKYLQVGRSQHRSMHQKMVHSLEKAYRKDNDHATRFYLSFLDDIPHPNAAVIQALNEGASRLVVVEVFLTESSHTEDGERQIRDVLDQFPEIQVWFTRPLHDSEVLKRMFVERANRYIGQVEKSKIGILLVGHGQPDEWDREWPTQTEQEISFRLDVLKHFEADGYTKENMSLAWMEFKKPKPAAKIEQFIRNGVEKVLYFPAAISADSLHSQFDIPELVRKAKVPEGFPLINLGAWNDDPLVIQAIKEKIDSALNRLT